jgi:nucleoside-diphosphate-sugar epimerase
MEPRYAPTRSGDVPHSLADLGRARKDLAYEPSVDLREGLRRTLSYYGILRDPVAARP